MEKKPLMIQVSDPVKERLAAIAQYHNDMSPNTLVSIVATELSRLEPTDVWMGLARLTQGAKPLPPEPKTPRARKKSEHAHASAAA